MKIRKNALMLSVIAMLLIPAFAATVKPSYALSTMFSVDTVDAPGMAVGEVFTVNVYVWDVEAMFGYQFDLSYDNSVIIATGNYGSYYPFTWEAATINDVANGVITTGFTMPSPELVGWYWYGQYPVFWAEFQVVDPAASPFALTNTIIADIHGNSIAHTTTDGWFRNLEGAPIAWFTPPEPVEALVDVTFTSLSTDPDGTIATTAWDWGDGTTGAGEVATHAWAAVGTYTVTLTVTNTAGISDTQMHTMTIIEPPLAGAIAIRGKPTAKHLDFTKYGDHKQWLKGWAKNIDPTRTELVRVDLDVWSADYGHVGAVPTPNQWLGPGVLGTFQGEFDMMDGKWRFVGGGVTEEEFTVFVTVYYADFFFDNDPNQPHWAQVADAPEVSYTFIVSETAPTPVIAYTYDSATGMLYLDGTGSYDPDTKWGDSIVQYRWRIYQQGVGGYIQLFGATQSLDLTASGSGNYRFQLRVTDSFSVIGPLAYYPSSTTYVYFTVP